MKLRQAISTVQSRHDHPAYGWAAVAATVAVTDFTARRSMSDVFRTASRKKITGPVLFLGWGYLSAHLFGFIPAKFDLFHQMSHVAGLQCRRGCPQK